MGERLRSLKAKLVSQERPDQGSLTERVARGRSKGENMQNDRWINKYDTINPINDSDAENIEDIGFFFIQSLAALSSDTPEQRLN